MIFQKNYFLFWHFFPRIRISISTQSFEKKNSPVLEKKSSFSKKRRSLIVLKTSSLIKVFNSEQINLFVIGVLGSKHLWLSFLWLKKTKLLEILYKNMWFFSKFFTQTKSRRKSTVPDFLEKNIQLKDRSYTNRSSKILSSLFFLSLRRNQHFTAKNSINL